MFFNRSVRLCLLLLLLGGGCLGQGEDPWADFDAEYFATLDTANTVPAALARFGPSLAARRAAGPITPELAYRYHRIALHLKVYDPGAVLPYADTAIVLRERAPAPKTKIAQSYYERARVYNLLGLSPRAQQDFEVAIDMMSEELVRQDSLADLAKRLAYFYREAAHTARQNGNFGLATLWLDKIPSLLRIQPHPKTAYEALLSRADVDNDAGNYEGAIINYGNALNHPYFERADPIDQGVVHLNLGVAHNRLGQTGEAEGRLLLAAELFAEGQSPQNKSFAESALVNTYNRAGRYDLATAYFVRGLTTAAPLYPGGKAHVLGELYARGATTRSLRGEFQGADSLLRRAFMALMEPVIFSGAAGLPQLEGATVYSKEDLLEALAAKRDNFIRAYTAGANPQGLEYALVTSHKIDSLLRLNRSELSLTASLAGLEITERREYAVAIDLALRLYRLSGDRSYLRSAYNFAAGGKSNLLRRYLTSPGLAVSMGLPEALVERKTRLEIDIAITEEALRTSSGRTATRLRDSLLLLRRTNDSIRRQVATAYPAFSQALRGFSNIDPDLAAASLAPERLVAEYFLSADSLYFFTLRKGEGLAVAVTPRPIGLGELPGSVLDEPAAAERFYRALITPLLRERVGVTRLQLIPDGELWNVPFSALRLNGRFLIEDFAVSLAYAAPLVFDPGTARASRRTEQRYLGYGISYADLLKRISESDLRSPISGELRSMGQLLWANREVARAADIMGGNYRLDEQATKDRFLTEAARNGGVVHLSMHGLLRDNPMESALVMMGPGGYSLLTMREVLGLRLPTQLTVLSACHTGGGPLRSNEGMQTIGRAFTAAGSAATITSTWEARDDATHDVLVAFYQHLEGGAPKDLALQRAIIGYLNTGTPTDRQPVNWANLVLTGEVGPIRQPTRLWSYGLLAVLALIGVVVWWRR